MPSPDELEPVDKELPNRNSEAWRARFGDATTPYILDGDGGAAAAAGAHGVIGLDQRLLEHIEVTTMFCFGCDCLFPDEQLSSRDQAPPHPRDRAYWGVRTVSDIHKWQMLEMEFLQKMYRAAVHPSDCRPARGQGMATVRDSLPGHDGGCRGRPSPFFY